MTIRTLARRLALAGTGLLLTGCSFHGLSSLPLPGAQGRGAGSVVYHAEIANVATLEPNSPVMIDDVVVGSVVAMKVRGWHADVEISVKPDTVVAANAVASVGQTSLLGSMHLELNTPPGQAPAGRLKPGATIPLDRSSTYPSTEQTLSSLAAVVNGGGLGQIGDIVHNFNAALSGHQDAIRDLIARLDTFVGILDTQRDDIVATMEHLNRFTATLTGQRAVLAEALHALPPALDVLIRQTPNIVTVLARLRTFSDTATGLINDTQADLVRNLHNLEPTVHALADIGPGIDDAIQLATVFPLSQNAIDRGVRGDYLNYFPVADITVPRLKSTLFLGTRWGVPGAEVVPAPGDPGYDWYYTKNPLGAMVVVPPSGSEVPAPPPPNGPAQVLSAGLPPAPPPGSTEPTPSQLITPPQFPPMDVGG